MADIHTPTGVPIIFVQTGNKAGAQGFLDIAVCQALAASPGNEVILLTDALRPGLRGATQVRLSDYQSGAVKFERQYRHTSVNPVEYERFCFSRWFSVREFVHRHGIERFCILDSDILLFSPIESFVAEFDGYRAGNWTWANVITASTLDGMCDYFERIFRDRHLLTALGGKYRIGRTPHLSDMMALFELAAGNPAFLNQKGLPAKGFDNNINLSFDGLFVMDRGIKQLTVGADGIPVARRTSDGGAVPFHFLHFQGAAKSLMPKFAWHGHGPAPRFQFRWPTLRRFLLRR
jgi:hypothetical protein